MKKIIITMYLLSAALLANAQEKLVWDYPVKPGTEEWNQLSNHQEMIDICQIPIDILQNISTKDLLEICLNYPLKIDLYAYSTLEEGIRRTSSHFNGFKEFLQRKDNFSSLYAYMKESKFNETVESKKSVLEKGEAIVMNSIVETFLSFNDVLQNSDQKQQDELIALSANRLRYKTQNKDKFSNYATTSSALLLGKLLQKSAKSFSIPQEVDSFLKNETTVNEEIITNLLETSKSVTQ